jgi:choline kinase
MNKIDTAIILAAGKGSRFRDSTGEIIPKPLYKPLGDLSIIEYSIHSLIQLEVQNIFLGCGYQKEKFEILTEKYPQVTLVYNPHFETRSSLYTLTMFNDVVTSSTFVLEADIIYDIHALLKLKKEFNGQSLFLGSTPLNLDDNVYYQADSGNLTLLSKTIDPAKTDGVMTGIWILEEDYLNLFAQYCKHLKQAFLTDYEVLLADYSRIHKPIKVINIPNLTWCEVDNGTHLDYALKEVLPKLIE